ncbi:MAG: hypothetical protein M1823_000131 [Watsoniomyces obsoletus]|nr:MAG: hypothetical protein M1823_000131 [Watsoniomyces obsoletus]
MGIVEDGNALPFSKLLSDYVFPSGTSQTFDSRDGEQKYFINLETSSSITREHLEACLNLIEETSAETYKASTGKWPRAKKRREMKLPDLRYLLVQSGSSSSEDTLGPIEGFLSYMLTYEDGHEVIYCYELHLANHLRGWGLGRKLMDLMEDVGKRFGVEKAMLTVFLTNGVGVEFYRKCG